MLERAEDAWTETYLLCYDLPEVLEVLFPLAYSPSCSDGYLQNYSDSDADFFVDVENGVEVGCNFWAVSEEAPTILFFHGNGETVADYEYFAPIYNNRGINLCVVDYRGYGASNGVPTVSNMLSDSHVIFQHLRQKLEQNGFTGAFRDGALAGQYACDRSRRKVSG